MLSLILGTAGTGKTTMLHERIEACIKDGGKAILIVPEQYSFESEKSLYRRLGARDALSVEVLSFTRLCDRVFREYGGLAGVHLDETAKYLLMSVALEEIGGALKAYRKNAGSAAFVQNMCDTVSELKTAGAAPDALRSAARVEGDGPFADKLEDIALIFDTYQAMIERGYSDPDDCLQRACKLLEGRDFFGGYRVFVDGFMAFMGAERQLLGQILERSPSVTVALTCEGLDGGDRAGVFAAVNETAERLIQLAKQHGSRVALPVVLREPVRFRNPALAHLAAEFPKRRPAPFSGAGEDRRGGEPKGVELAACEDFYDELDYVAARISALVRTGMRYREIAVIARSLERYLVPLQTVFGRYGIPFFTDLRADVQIYPLVSGVLCALDAARTGYAPEHLLALAKNCVSGIDPVEAGQLENYCFAWGITGAAWAAPFVNNPDGMVEGFTEAQSERLEAINRTRERLVAPVERLRRDLAGCDGRGFAAAVFAWLEQSGASSHLQESADGMDETEAKLFLDAGAQVWDLLIGLLDVFGGALAGVYLPLVRLTELFRMSTASSDIGALPQTLDQVIVGTADRIRPNEPRAVFVIGLNEGEFPQWGGNAGIFSLPERDLLKERGIDLLRTAERSTLFENYFVYFALTQASESLWMSYPQRSTAGTGLAASSAAERVRELLGLTLQSACRVDAAERACNEATAFDAMTRGWRENSPAEAALKSYFSRRAPHKTAFLEECGAARVFSLRDRESARLLFGRQMKISPSRAERYYSCPFSYFCQVGLRLQVRRKVEFSPLESGSLIHLVLERVVGRYGGKGLSQVGEEELKAEVAAIINEDLSSKIADFEGMPARFKYLFRRLVNTLMRLIQRLALEFEQCEFQPAAFELPIGLDKEVKPLELETADGTRVIVEGVVDRVDLLERGGKRYLRVVDYKSGSKSFNLADVYYGLNMQMLIYLFTLCENLPGTAEETIPSGVLYMPARDSVITADRNAPPEEIVAERVKTLKMTGILLEDREVLSAMEPDLSGIFIPVKAKKDGGYDARSSLANLAQMGAIKRQVETLLTGIADGLCAGEIAAAPVDGLSGYAPCGWCDYKSICAHEEGDPVRSLADLDRAEVLKLMEGGEQDG